MIKGFSYRKRELQKCVAYVKQRKGYILMNKKGVLYE